jgi:hypothetical protein
MPASGKLRHSIESLREWQYWADSGQLAAKLEREFAATILPRRRMTASSPTRKFEFLAARPRRTKIAISALPSTLPRDIDSGHWFVTQRSLGLEFPTG